MCNSIENNQELYSLTGIRFFAAVVVVFSHFTQLGLMHVPLYFLDIVDHGRSAVSLFFVLSGFVLAYKYNKNILLEKGVRSFYMARFARIYPVALFGLFLSSFVTLYLLIGDNNYLFLSWYAIKENFAKSLVASFIAQLFFLTAWFPFSAINQPWNGPMWSVSCEAFFYAIFPWLVGKLRSRSLLFVGCVVFVCWLVQGIWILFVENNFSINRRGFIVSQFPLTHLFEFIIGIYSALIFDYLKIKNKSINIKLGWIFVVFSLLFLLFLGLVQPIRPSYYLQSPLFALLILGLSLTDGSRFGILSARPIVFMGQSSFSLYVIHIPLAHIYEILGLYFFNGWIIFSFTLVFSAFVYKYIEEPFRKVLRKKFHKPVLKIS